MKGNEYLDKGDLWVEYLPDEDGKKYISVATGNGTGMEFVASKTKKGAVRQLQKTIQRFEEIIKKVEEGDIEYDREWIWGEEADDV